MSYVHYGGVRGPHANGTTPLDDVPKSLVGAILVDDLRGAVLRRFGVASAADCFLRNLSWLERKDLYLQAVDTLRLRIHGDVETSAKWKRHLEQLKDWGIARAWTESDGAFFATNTYFAVLKEANLARSIVDCAAFSNVLKEIASIAKVRLPTIPDLLARLARALREAAQQGARLAILLSDLRHFFHQIPLDREISPFFAVRIGTARYLWRVLPMGHTISPLVAQTVSFALLLLSGAAGEGGLDQLPSFATGSYYAAAIWYDNLMAAGASASLDNLRKRWKDRCEEFHATLKYTNLYKGVQLSADDTDDDRAIALGLRLAVTKQGDLLYRHRNRNVQEWIEHATRLRAMATKLVTRRQMARLLGIIMFDGYIATASAEFENVDLEWARIGKRLGRDVFSDGQRWDAPARYPAAAADLEKMIAHVLAFASANPYRTVSAARTYAAPDLKIATDASSGRWGGCVVHGTNVSSVAGGDWSDTSNKLHISAKEALAVLLTLKRHSIRDDMVIRLACDAQAVVFALRRRYSGSNVLNSIITRIYQVVGRASLQVVWVAGEDNIADVITRPNTWGGDSMQAIDWTAADARRRVAATSARLDSFNPLVSCERPDIEEVLADLDEDARIVDTDSVKGFDLSAEEQV